MTEALGSPFKFVSIFLEFDFKLLPLSETLELFRVYLLSSFYMRQGSLGREPCYFVLKSSTLAQNG